MTERERATRAVSMLVERGLAYDEIRDILLDCFTCSRTPAARGRLNDMLVAAAAWRRTVRW